MKQKKKNEGKLANSSICAPKIQKKKKKTKKANQLIVCSAPQKLNQISRDAGDAKNMEYTFDQMRAEGMKADTKTFCCLVRGYANAGLFHKVINTVQLAGKLEIPENTSLFNSVIYACAKAEDILEMERVFK